MGPLGSVPGGKETGVEQSGQEGMRFWWTMRRGAGASGSAWEGLLAREGGGTHVCECGVVRGAGVTGRGAPVLLAEGELACWAREGEDCEGGLVRFWGE